MKINILTAIIALSGLTACSSLLEETPQSFISPEQFYKTSADGTAAVNAIYYNFASNGDGNQPIYNSLFNTGMDFMTDDLDAGPGSPNNDVRTMAVLSHISANLRVKEIWQQHYSGINKANVALARIPGIEMDVKLKNKLLGEARFLRALYYFNLVRLYGAVPLLLTDQTQESVEDLDVARTPVDDVYTQIITDLKTASVLFKTGSTPETGRATEGAAKALLSKVYLTKRDWTNSILYADSVINGSFGYDLFADYSQVFLPAYKNGKEHIFSIQFKNGVQTNQVLSRDIKSGVPGLKGSYGDQVRFYTVGNDNYFSIFKLFPKGDKRKYVSFTTKYVSPTNGKTYITLNAPGDSVPFINKYWDPNYASTNVSEANATILRFAEVLLIRAEAENELNGPANAYVYVNRVRKRAGLADLKDLTQNKFREAVYLERRLELVGEYQRYFDLIRETDSIATGEGPLGRGILSKSLKAVGKTNVVVPRHYLYPIPQTERERNPKLTQNPGWE
ncbi:RagB/SusD family nutrient uptake outer membrane protein [Parabacteroides sp. FAFU027]|uniref:RagB/SusD family nutrient uptake outer membrane protein n=1 Tax=Parabacteroides sp. FAFU027 TaxID=2922715 RepID=UPI001FB02FFE|nr:RagB/SusD family nutrient uptake outer membrane protein [Parabacteroides sp. FAFU027]